VSEIYDLYLREIKEKYEIGRNLRDGRGLGEMIKKFDDVFLLHSSFSLLEIFYSCNPNFV